MSAPMLARAREDGFPPDTPPDAPTGGRMGSRLRDRLIASLVALAGASLLGLAAWMEPESSGQGTHQQLGLQACGFLSLTGLPCATCGCTTSVALAADGRLGAAVLNQPFGAAVALALACLTLVCAYAAWRGLSLTPLLLWAARPGPVLIALGVALVSWGYRLLLTLGV